jgi:hypothetical protein
VSEILLLRGLPTTVFDELFGPLLRNVPAHSPPGRLSEALNDTCWAEFLASPKWAVYTGFCYFLLSPIVKYLSQLNPHCLHYHPAEAAPPSFRYDFDAVNNIDVTIPDSCDSALYPPHIVPGIPVSSLYRMSVPTAAAPPKLMHHAVPRDEDPLSVPVEGCSTENDPKKLFKQREAFTVELIAAFATSASHMWKHRSQYYESLKLLASVEDVNGEMTCDESNQCVVENDDERAPSEGSA